MQGHCRNSKNESVRHFDKHVAYITPWNKKGYDIAKRFLPKFTHLAPVWYEIKSEGTTLVLEGRQNADIGWVSAIRMKGDALVLPRFVMEAFPLDLLRKKRQRRKAFDLITNECKTMGYDGVVLESWSRWATFGVLHDPDLRNVALQFIAELGHSLHSVSLRENTHLQLVYVIPAPRSKNIGIYDFGPKDFEALNEDVDGFSLMTYDFSGPQYPGPLAPLDWIRSSLQIILATSAGNVLNHAQKIFVGLNFYGNDKGTGVGAITGQEYLSLLSRYKPILQWDNVSSKHYFTYFDGQVNHAVFYPSSLSIAMRLDEAQTWGAGISIWEIGQGLDCFYDLL